MCMCDFASGRAVVLEKDVGFECGRYGDCPN